MNPITSQLLDEAIKHKGTDVGGKLQWAANTIDDLYDHIASIENENKELRADCKKMHEGLLKIDEMATQFNGIAFGSMPINAYATCIAKDISSHANIMNYHGVDGYGKKGRPTLHKDMKIKTVVI